VRAAALILLLLVTSAVCSETAGPATAGNGAAAPAPLEVIESCSRAEDAEDAIGVNELEPFCPGIEHALVQFGYAPFISESQLNGLSTYSLVDLQHLAERYTGAGAVAALPDVARLDSILHSIEEPVHVESPGLLERFKRWLRDILGRQQAEPGSWLNRWLPEFHVPQSVTTVLTYSLVVLVLALAIAVVINELRANGVLKRDKAARSGAVGPTGGSAAIAALQSLDTAPLHERPSILLRMLVTTLVKSGRLRTERSLTHRELASGASLDEQSQREVFQRVAALGERTLYGGQDVPEPEIESVIAAGRSLDSQLRAAAESA